MLLANICAAKIIHKSQTPSLYRIHPKPDPLKIKNLEGFARSRKINITFGKDGKVEELSNLVEISKDRKDKETIHMQILQSLSLAIYDTEVSEHFALGFPAYTHFTSPIRRYPDLMVHRALRALIQTSPSKIISLNEMKSTVLTGPLYPYNLDQVEEIASDSSTKERVAEKAERDAVNYLKCAFALDNIGEEFQGTVSGVTNFGLFIHLDSIHIEGLCHIKYLPRKEYYEFDENSKMLIGRNSGHSYSLGDKLSVKVKDADLTTQRIDIEILK
jgi:ribonuclease R